MGLIVGIFFLMMKVCAIAGSLVLQEYSGHEISSSPTNFPAVSPIIEGSSHHVTQKKQKIRNSHSPTSPPNPSPHFKSASAPQATIGHAPYLLPITPLSEPHHAKEHVLPPDASVPVPSAPSTLPRTSLQNPPAMPPPPSNLPVPAVLSPSTLARNLPQSPTASTIPPSSLPAPYVHNASSPESSYEVTPPTKSQTPPYVSPLFPPSLVPKSKPRHHGPLSTNPGSAVPPFYNSISPVISPSATSPVRTTMPVVSHPRKLPQPIDHNSSIPPSTLHEPLVSPVSSPLPNIDRGRDVVPVSSSPNRTINISPTQHTPGEVPYVHKVPSSYNRTHHQDSSYMYAPPTISHPPPNSVPVAPSPSYLTKKFHQIHNYSSIPPSLLPAPSPSSYNHTHPDSSDVPTSPTKYHPSPSISLLYPAPPPSSKNKISHHASGPPNIAPSVHNAPTNSSYTSSPPPKSHSSPSLSPIYPPPSGPKSKPTHFAPPPSNPAPSVHNAPPDSSFKPSPPTESHPTPSLSPLFSSPPALMSRPRHHAPPPPNKAPFVHNAPSSYNHFPSDSSYDESTPPKTLDTPRSLSPLYPPQPGLKSTSNVHPSPNPVPSMENALPPDSFDPMPPVKSRSPPSLSPSYPPPPPGPPWHYAPPPPNLGLAMPPFHTSVTPAISPSAPSIQTTTPLLPPKLSPLWSPPKVPKPIQALPPPPPNEDCSLVTCKEPLTNTLPGTPCDCVMPMQIAMSLGVALYTFFPLVSELAMEMASGVNMKPNQVRIMGANADDQDPEKTITLIDLVPIGENFDDFTARLTAQRLWLKQVSIKSYFFGDYEVLYVKYPGLPPSPPLPSSTIGTNGGRDGRDNNGMTQKPLGVDVNKHRHGHKLNGGIISMIVLAAVVLVVLFFVLVWVLLLKRRDKSPLDLTSSPALPSITKSSGIGASMTGSEPTSASLSFRSSMACTGSAKTFSLSDMEKATDKFNESQVLGEGGFGLVYSGLLDDGTRVAVKVLKRVGKQGGREFLAEVEMLSRLHHRNLVRLIGFCTEDRNRCLVYELVPNGSVQSHLHGEGKETHPLDWASRLKIALGSARGLAYLHEDSSPRVIHRDFKSSNILLEHDFTPKVSDFGLARSALDEEGRHITTRIMGTFGYLAPEYAMTGHLLVKSDVYSYGVVLLELLTGRKPVDMSMPPGQENLVAWAQPLLMAPECLPLLVDPMLLPDCPFESVAKVAAVASMCVQTDVSHRPSMGEVVQALKLVCTEWEEPTNLGSTLVDLDAQVSTAQPTYSSYDSPSDLESGCSVLGLGSWDPTCDHTG